MAAKAEILTGTTVAPRTTTRSDRPGIARRAGGAVAAWVRRGQLGSSHYTELGRHTGGRI